LGDVDGRQVVQVQVEDEDVRVVEAAEPEGLGPVGAGSTSNRSSARRSVSKPRVAPSPSQITIVAISSSWGMVRPPAVCHPCVQPCVLLRFRAPVDGERFIQTLTNRWAYGAIYGSSAERTAALPRWLDHYNFRRGHGSLGHRPPAARLAELEQPRE
jgi:Integrase core domain